MRSLILGLLLMAGCSDAVSPEEALLDPVRWTGEWSVDGHGFRWDGAFNLVEMTCPGCGPPSWILYDFRQTVGEGPVSGVQVSGSSVRFDFDDPTGSQTSFFRRHEGTYGSGTISGDWWWDCRPLPECRADPVVDSLLNAEAGTFTARRR